MASTWILITGGTVIDGSGDPPEQVGVLLRDDRIHAVGVGAALENIPRGEPVHVIDAAGKWVMPGMIDVHCHMTYGESKTQEEQDLYTGVEARTLRAAWNTRKVLRAGVTGISQPGGSYYIGVAIRDAIRDRMLPGPRMTTAGRYLTTSNGLTDWYPEPVGVPDSSIGTLTNNPGDMVDTIRRQVKNGVDLIKLSDSPFGDYQAFTGDELKIVADLAHQLNKRVTIHARGSAEVSAAVAAGFDWIMHGNLMTDEVIDKLAQSRIPLVPTLLLLANQADYGHLVGVPARAIDGCRRMLEKTAETLHRAHAAGVTMVAGTDTGFATTPYGEWHARELQLLMEYAGLSAMEAIQAATVNAAPMVNLAGQIGEVRPGCLADLLVLSADPVSNVRALQDPASIEMIIQDGEVLDVTGEPDRPSWPHQPSRVQATATLTREVVNGGSASSDPLGWEEEQARDLFSDIARRGRAARVPDSAEA
ncbi:MAG: amidohydrolase family protein [Streptosporangiaceae bacterium]